MTLLWAALTMAAKDAVGTLLVVAEAKGRPVLAGALDAAGDLATIGVTVVGAGQVIQHGWTWHTAAILAVMLTTSFFGTIVWTSLGRRIRPDAEAQAVAVESSLTTADLDALSRAVSRRIGRRTSMLAGRPNRDTTGGGW